ncbi:hypothetical protein NARC_10066 [Candidatus Nitrosocosmicus arcticus]|uniref:Uncharacterized protein n=1 Tax=Candidatus Nitrosocosmicus arcticus TaxID=2035267 RepID=A0A557SYH9_9ARCH|nr:hypothetical protein NARC_10066 [Candidatus Nitrosocosmicus arcticus]
MKLDDHVHSLGEKPYRKDNAIHQGQDRKFRRLLSLQVEEL